MVEIPETRDLYYRVPKVRYLDLGWCLGRDLGADIILMDDGSVKAIWEQGEALVNSSLNQYVQSLHLVGFLRDNLPGDESDETSIVECESALEAIDPKAYDAGQYWALIMEQIRDEMF